ncbi:hypothetical protein WOLCODRAFT_92766 [Wolfiporia cocos MD-104 SS10]|uniref:Uncharacterized protein n=1 Tax=Wolfiporia cocos (strain MD-104) TaxID=742152 RepID=A0A2H3J2M9_WOLCO|nr:hypothetical protein WOLCODRAFT_92766 [Wolfiporia cocos MD-104 SS10]
MTFEDTDRYGVTAFSSWLDWTSVFSFPQGHGSVRLGSEGREYNVSMFQQLECLNTLRLAMIHGPDSKSGRCLNYLRQAVLCASDITIDALNMEVDGKLTATNGVGSTHICRNWLQVYEFVVENQRGPLWLNSD